jgi:hypothetical protein
MSDILASLLLGISFFACKSWRMREPKQDVCQFVISSGLFLQHCLHTMLPALQSSNYKQESSQKSFCVA